MMHSCNFIYIYIYFYYFLFCKIDIYMDFKRKYYKYKQKYNNIRSIQTGGGTDYNVLIITNIPWSYIFFNNITFDTQLFFKTNDTILYDSVVNSIFAVHQNFSCKYINVNSGEKVTHTQHLDDYDNLYGYIFTYNSDYNHTVYNKFSHILFLKIDIVSPTYDENYLCAIVSKLLKTLYQEITDVTFYFKHLLMRQWITIVHCTCTKSLSNGIQQNIEMKPDTFIESILYALLTYLFKQTKQIIEKNYVYVFNNTYDHISIYTIDDKSNTLQFEITHIKASISGKTIILNFKVLDKTLDGDNHHRYHCIYNIDTNDNVLQYIQTLFTFYAITTPTDPTLSDDNISEDKTTLNNPYLPTPHISYAEMIQREKTNLSQFADDTESLTSQSSTSSEMLDPPGTSQNLSRRDFDYDIPHFIPPVLDYDRAQTVTSQTVTSQSSNSA